MTDPSEQDEEGMELELPMELYTALRLAAIKRGVSLDQVIVELLEQSFRNEG